MQTDFELEKTEPLKAAEQLLKKKGADGEKLGRFMPNPDEWGPGSRSTSHAAAFAASDGADGADGDAAAAGTAPQSGAGSGHAVGSGAMLDKRALNQGKKKRRRQERAAAEGEEGAGEEGVGEEGR